MLPIPKTVNPLCKAALSVACFVGVFLKMLKTFFLDVPTDISRAPKPRTDRPARQQITEQPKVICEASFVSCFFVPFFLFFFVVFSFSLLTRSARSRKTMWWVNTTFGIIGIWAMIRSKRNQSKRAHFFFNFSDLLFFPFV
jgi:hypothetical protein